MYHTQLANMSIEAKLSKSQLTSFIFYTCTWYKKQSHIHTTCIIRGGRGRQVKADTRLALAPIYSFRALCACSEQENRARLRIERLRSCAGGGDGHPVLLLQPLEQDVLASLIPRKGLFYAVQLFRVVLTGRRGWDAEIW